MDNNAANGIPEKQIKIPAYYMRGGTSKGVFFKLEDLPLAAQQPGAARDAIIMRVIGSPDPYAKHTDGMGGATSSTSKAVILSKSEREGYDVDYLFAQVAIDKAFVDYGGNCGNLSAAVGAFAIESGLVTVPNTSQTMYSVKIWQQNIQKTLVAHVPVNNGEVQETGSFMLDGVCFPAAEIVLDFVDPAGEKGAAESGVLPTGNCIDTLNVPNIGEFQATYVTAGIPTVFLRADELGLTGRELQSDVNNSAELLAKFETIRAHAGVAMGLFNDVSDAVASQHTPKIAFVTSASDYETSSGKHVAKQDMDLHVRALSMGKLHHAMMGTAAVAIGAAAAIEGSIVNIAAGSESREQVTFAHPSGTLTVGAQVEQTENNWHVSRVSMSRSARVLMEGKVRVPISVE